MRSLSRHLAVVLLLGLLPASHAFAQTAYVANFQSNNVSTIDTRTNLAIGSPIPVGNHPKAIAIAPDGRTAYVINEGSGTVSVIDTHTNQVVGSPIAVEKEPSAIAITPDGRTAYVTDEQSGKVSVIDTRTNQAVGSPITVGKGPLGIAISPDGRTAYVSNENSNNVSVIDIRTNQVVGSDIPVGEEPHGIAITPDGRTVYVTNYESRTVSVIDARINQAIGAPIATDEKPTAIAIAPDGRTAYVANFGAGSITVIDTGTNQPIGPSIAIGGAVRGIAVSPGGRFAYVSTGANGVAVIDTRTNQMLGLPIAVGETPIGIAIVPDQAPRAAISAPRFVRPGVPLTLNASGSTDPDGSIAGYDWAFGDGQTATGTNPAQAHAYATPGTYQVMLRLTDDEGCSAAFVFTGQTAFCNGSALAGTTQTVKVAYPGVRLSCPKSAKARGCKFKLQALTKKRKPRPESAVARVKLKAGHSGTVPLKPTVAFRLKLATASSVLVREAVLINGVTRTRVHRLKIVQ